MTTHTITNAFGEKERVSLPAPHYTAEARGQSDFTGIWITALYSGPKTGRRFARTDSIWENRQTGGMVGTRIHELEESQYLDYCERVGCEPEHITVKEV